MPIYKGTTQLKLPPTFSRVYVGSNVVYIRPDLEWQTEETGTFTGTLRMDTGVAWVDFGGGDGWQEIADGVDNLSYNYDGATGDKTIRLSVQNPAAVTEFRIFNTNSKGNIENWASALANWSNIQHFYISINSFEGDLSDWATALENWTNIQRFYIDRNSFTGDLSGWNTALANWTNIQRFYIFNNSFEGDLSGWASALANWANIERFLIDRNSFEGDLSGWALALEKWTNIQDFYIYNNSFTGDLSGWNTAYANWSNLFLFLIYDNLLTAAPYLEATSAWNGREHRFENNPQIPASNIDNVIIGLDTHDGTGGNLNVSGTNGGTMTYNDLSANAKTAHDNLVNNKGWAITLDT